VIVLAKDLEKLLGKRPCVFRAAGVGHGLATAGLLFGELDVKTEPPQHTERRKPDLRV